MFDDKGCPVRLYYGGSLSREQLRTYERQMWNSFLLQAASFGLEYQNDLVVPVRVTRQASSRPLKVENQ